MAEIVLWLLLGGIIGGIVVDIFFIKNSNVGVLKIDSTNPEKDVYNFDIYDLNGLKNSKYVLIRVDKKSDTTLN